MKNRLLSICIIVVMLLSSCSNLILFTKNTRDNLNKNHQDISKVQFYNSDKIVLKRNLTKDETQVAKGVIVLENGKYFEEIIIPKGTKGVVTKKGAEYLKIAFEEGEERDLRFDMNENQEYQISADKWKNNFGSVRYDTTVYFIVPSSSHTLLMVHKEYISNYEKRRRVLKGRKVAR
jgi:hypothetical protein